MFLAICVFLINGPSQSSPSAGGGQEGYSHLYAKAHRVDLGEQLVVHSPFILIIWALCIPVFYHPYIIAHAENYTLGSIPLTPPLLFHFFHLHSKIKELLEDAHRVLRTLDRVARGPLVAVNLPVVAALEALVAEEVHRLEGHAAGLGGLGFEVLETVRLVPAGGEDVEGDLAADGKAASLLSVTWF